MRPTAKAAGNLATPNRRASVSRGFNEADGQGRRKSPPAGHAGSPGAGFNEADGQGRRKCRSPRPIAAVRRCFNEADGQGRRKWGAGKEGPCWYEMLQ